MLVARYFPPEVFGSFLILQVIAFFLTRITTFGLDLSIPRFIAGAQDDAEKSKLIASAVFFRCCVAVAVSTLVLALNPLLTPLFGTWVTPGLLVFVPALYLLQSLTQLLAAALQGLFLFHRLALVNLLASGLHLLLILALILFSEQGVAALAWAKIASMLVPYLLTFLSLPLHTPLRLDLPLLRRVLRFGLPLQINDILTFLFLRIDSLLVAVLLGPADIAYLEIARKIPEGLTSLYDAFRSVYFPFLSSLFASAERQRLSAMVNHSIRLISFITILSAFITILYGAEIISFFFSSMYLPSVPIFVLLMVGLGLTFVEYTMGYCLVAIGDVNKPIIINSIRSAVSLVGNWVLIQRLGLVGSGIAHVISAGVSCPIDAFFLRRRQIPVSSANYLKPVSVLCVCSFLYLAFGQYTALSRPLSLILFLVASGLLRIITLTDLLTVSAGARERFHHLARRGVTRHSRA